MKCFNCNYLNKKPGICVICNHQMSVEVVKKPYKMPKNSVKRTKQNAEYNKQVKEFLKGKACVVFPELRATQVHHAAGRIELLLLDQKYWLPVSDKGHVEVENNPKWAKEHGFSVSRLNIK